MTQAIELPKGAVRSRELHRLVDLHAAAEACAALHSDAERAKEGVVAVALQSADALLGGIADDGTSQDRLRDAVSSPAFMTLLPGWMQELRQVASAQPETGACTVATALKLWSWTMSHVPVEAQAVDELAEAIGPVLAARSFALATAKEPAGRRDLSHVYAARVSAQAATTCAEVVFGYRRHLTWDAEGCAACFVADELDGIDALIPGFASGGRTSIDVLESDGSHPSKQGPCASFDGLDAFLRLRKRLDGCLTGARIAKDRAAAAIASSDRRA